MLTFLLACKPPPEENQPPIDPVAVLSAPGPHAVGYREESVEWTAPELAEPRTLRLAAWFPTDADSGEPVSYLGIEIDPDVLGGVEPIAGALPVAIFSHGHQGFAENSSFLMEHLASHGWLVLAPDHTGNTTFDGSQRETAIYWQRPLDLSAVLDHAEASWDTTGEVVALGHSFGGYTLQALGGATYDPATLAGCPDGTDFCSTMSPEQQALFEAGFTDPRVRALVAMAPGDFRLFGDAGVAAVAVPELLMTGGLDPQTEDGLRYVAALDGADDLHLHLPDAGHQGFTDFSGLLGDPEGSIDPEEGFRIVRTYALAFARVHGLGEADWIGILDGSESVSGLAEIEPAG